MDSYNDLQRFKDKTGAYSIDFKEMSALKQQPDMRNNSILKQLSQHNQPNTQSGHASYGSFATPETTEPATSHREQRDDNAPPELRDAENSSIERPASSSLFDSLASMQKEPPMQPKPTVADLGSRVIEGASTYPANMPPLTETNVDISLASTPQHSDVLAHFSPSIPVDKTSESSKAIALQVILKRIESCH